MTKETAFQDLRAISTVLLDNELDYSELKSALEQLKKLLLNITDLDIEHFENCDPIRLPSGKAIGPKWAGACIDDIMRTKNFVSGVYEAVLKVRSERKDKPVHILYAGTGPFATLVLPLITVFGPDEVQFEFLEINPISKDSAESVFSFFEATGYIRESHLCDAAAIQLSEPDVFDILVTECLQLALRNEPQVTIVYNLLTQLRPDVLLIPEQISLHPTLIHSSQFELHRDSSYATQVVKPGKLLDSVFTLNKDSVHAYKNRSGLKYLQFPPVVATLTEDDINHYKRLALATEITIFEDIKLGLNQSGLTLPYMISQLDIDPVPKGLKAQYVLGDSPGLNLELQY